VLAHQASGKLVAPHAAHPRRGKPTEKLHHSLLVGIPAVAGTFTRTSIL
jgi:hypothetical protein